MWISIIIMNTNRLHRLSLSTVVKNYITSQSESRIRNANKYFHLRRSVTTVAKTSVFEVNRCLIYPAQIRSVSSTTQEKSSEENEKNFQRLRPGTTIDEDEVNKFSKLSALWWDEAGEFKALHSLNEMRIPLIRDVLVSLKTIDQYDVTRPLEGFLVLDVGSGGGILSEPLARLGASVTGLEASEESIKIAQAHLIHDPAIQDKLQYVQCTVEELAESQAGKFDAVVASEVLEHVTDASLFVTCACKLVKPGGSIFFTTLNKTRLSYILGIAVAENILGVVSPGTHDWEKFVPPVNLQHMLEKNNFITRLVHGMCYNPLTNRWTWIKDTSINYALHAVKPLEADGQQGHDSQSPATNDRN
uniref:Ubiquinone biosynthesis O-methyltransferase, mitochondrial n=1 Tax=Arion vulgaris TaxID=1028688 RepID=A0A0B7A3G2_9EUPU